MFKKILAYILIMPIAITAAAAADFVFTPDQYSPQPAYYFLSPPGSSGGNGSGNIVGGNMLSGYVCTWSGSNTLQCNGGVLGSFAYLSGLDSSQLADVSFTQLSGVAGFTAQTGNGTITITGSNGGSINVSNIIAPNLATSCTNTTQALTGSGNQCINLPAGGNGSYNGNITNATGNNVALTNPTITTGTLLKFSFAGLPVPGTMYNYTASNTSANTIAFAFNGLTLADNIGDPAYAVNVSGSINFKVSGSGGMCNGETPLNGTWYGTYVVCNASNCNASCLSSNLTGNPPGVVSNYAALTGAVELTSGALVGMSQVGRTASIAWGFASQTINSASPTAINLANAIPPFATTVYGDIEITVAANVPANTRFLCTLSPSSAGAFATPALSQWFGIMTGAANAVEYWDSTGSVMIITPQTVWGTQVGAVGSFVYYPLGWSF